MPDPLDLLAEDRALRDAARANFHANLQRVANDLQDRGIGERMSARAMREVKELGSKALGIADQSKGIIAATIAAIMLWLLRNPLIILIKQFFPDEAASDDDTVQRSDSETE